jgi:hypothetical protein
MMVVAACGESASALPSDSTAPTSSAAVGTSPAAAPPTIGKLGDRVESNGTAITVTKAQTLPQMPDGQKAGADNVYLIADITLENVSGSDVSYSPYTFQLKDADGKSYTAALTLDTKALRQGSLSKGQKAQGYVAFQLSKAAKGLVLEYIRPGFAPIDITLQAP